MIKSGIKKEEYRDIKPYYNSRLEKYTITKKEERIKFRNGYTNMSPTMTCKCKITKGTGKTEWGAEENKEYYIITIKEIEKE